MTFATDSAGDAQNISLGDIGDALKKIGNAIRLPGAPKIPYAADGAELSGDAASGDHLGALAGALQAAGGHAQALLDDWDNQPENVKRLFPPEILDALAKQFGKELSKPNRN